MSSYNVLRGLAAAKYYGTHENKEDTACDGGQAGTVRETQKHLLRPVFLTC